MERIALTSGEPAGIGPELCVTIAAEQDWDCELVCFGDRDLLAERARAIGIDVALPPFDPAAPAERHCRGELKVAHRPLAAPAEAGRLDPANGRYVLRLLDAALEGIAAGRFDALVTAPVQKSVINEAGVSFSGHTEYLAERTGVALPVMLLVAGTLRVALATTHLALRDVPAALTRERLIATLRIIDADLRRLWGLARPRIAVCGLNPHAGESGHLGDEEVVTIGPAVDEARRQGLSVTGPLPADTVFVPRELAQHDVVLAMYHDQGLPVLKHAGFGEAVNVTLGLPIVRTSVDHGTALALAGSGRADCGSLRAALRLALEFARRRRSAAVPD